MNHEKRRYILYALILNDAQKLYDVIIIDLPTSFYGTVLYVFEGIL